MTENAKNVTDSPPPAVYFWKTDTPPLEVPSSLTPSLLPTGANENSQVSCGRLRTWEGP